MKLNGTTAVFFIEIYLQAAGLYVLTDANLPQSEYSVEYSIIVKQI